MRIRQVVLAARDLAAGREFIGPWLGLAEPFRDPGVAEFGIDNAVFTFGDQFIEVISPVREGTACGRHLDRHGDGGYMLILQTDDLDREKARWQAMDVRRVWSAAFDDIAATHLHPKDIGGAIVSVDQPRPPPSWRWGGPAWRVAGGLAGRQRVRGIELWAADPEALARRWAQVLGLAEPVATDAGWRLALSDGYADFAASPQGLDGVAGFVIEAADPASVLAQARARGLSTDGRRVTALGVQWTVNAISAVRAVGSPT